MGKKVAVITGASSGMGQETAIALIQKGYIVYGGARRVQNMEDIKKKGGHILPLDVTNEESMQSFVDTILKEQGRIDILINNAGYGSCGSIEDIPMEEVKHQYEVNVFGLGRMIQLVLPTMRNQHSGRIVNISSMGGRFTTPFCGWYHSTKYAVEAISDALRMETKPYQIETVLVEPGLIQTNWGVIAAKNIRKYSGKGVYRKNAEHAVKYYEQRYGEGHHGLSDPKQIAQIIAKAATVKNPKSRYLVGKNAKLFVFLKGLLSDNAFQSVTVSSMGLEKEA